jgi:hypothetical protein
VKVARRRRAGRADGYPTVRARIVTPAGVKPVPADIKKIAAPDDHFDTGPDCRVIVATRGGVGGANGCPTVGARIVSAPGVKKVLLRSPPPQTIISLPVHTAV